MVIAICQIRNSDEITRVGTLSPVTVYELISNKRADPIHSHTQYRDGANPEDDVVWNASPFCAERGIAGVNNCIQKE